MRLGAIAFALLSLSAHAVDEGKFLISGAGGMSCGSWLQETPNNPAYRIQAEQWVEGFVTGYNYYSSPNVTPPDSSSISSYLDTYCRNNPLHYLIQAASALVTEVGGKSALHKFKR